MKIGVPREIAPDETRVALTPRVVSRLTGLEHEVMVEKAAGMAAAFMDDQYRRAGARIIQDPVRLYEAAEVVFKVRPPRILPGGGCHEEFFK